MPLRDILDVLEQTQVLPLNAGEREGFKAIERPFVQISQRVVTPAAI